MNINEAFPSNYLKASDFPSDVLLTIASVAVEDIGDDEKPIVHFREVKKGLVLNKTNANVIIKLYGSNTDAWIGAKIILFSTSVEFRGDTVPGIRVRAPSTGTPIQSVPSTPSSAAMAWKKFQSLNVGKTAEEIAADWKRRLALAFPGADPRIATPEQWARFVASDFACDSVLAPPVDDVQVPF